LAVSLISAILFVRGWLKKLSEAWKYFGVALLLASVFVMMTAIRAFVGVVAIMIFLFIAAVCLMCVKTQESSAQIAGFIKKSLVIGSLILFVLLLRGFFSLKEIPDLRTIVTRQMQSDLKRIRERNVTNEEGSSSLDLKRVFGDAKVKYRWLIEPKYGNAGYPFSEGLWGVEKDGLWGYVDSADNVVIDFKYLFVGMFQNGKAFVVMSRDINDEKKDIAGVIDKEGKYIIQLRQGLVFQGQSPDDNDRWPFCTPEGKYGFLNLSGDEHIPAVFDAIKKFSEGMVAVQSEGRWGVIDKDGKWLIAPRYQDLGVFWNGYIPFQSDEGLWGLLNVKGEVIFEPKCTKIIKSVSRSDPLLVQFDNKQFKTNYLNEKLEFVISSDQYEVHSEEYAGGLVFLNAPGPKSADTYTALDIKGNVAFEFPKMIASPWRMEDVKGYYKMVAKGIYRKMFVINEKGEMLLPPNFLNLKPSEEGIIAVQSENLKGDKRWGLLILGATSDDI
ncbi:MAG: WG repeat-containing protein, partial [Synergistaceae bacterium]|jgi:hypothetical protein|nr:WG repeat-containing protein [Synergistaceae bacterium]